ncbi:hypothetical protein C8Q74DRAFT_668423 [Fomes fomentarius]|nr:hypothetical protein C8Q74DRAFT_668423 [Fomes fomentarius]
MYGHSRGQAVIFNLESIDQIKSAGLAVLEGPAPKKHVASTVSPIPRSLLSMMPPRTAPVCPPTISACPTPNVPLAIVRAHLLPHCINTSDRRDDGRINPTSTLDGADPAGTSLPVNRSVQSSAYQGRQANTA